MADCPIPTVTAMLVCDQTIAEQGTNKKSLIGIFEQVGSSRFPTAMPRLSVYVRLVDGSGRYLFKLRVVSLKDEALLADIEVDAEISNPMQAAELVFNIVGFPIPEPGKYEFQLYTGDVYLHRVTMEVQAMQGGIPPWQQQSRPRPS
ncbi:MAG TPA: hypothetical protein VN776_14300 [Terracidiphilus sp.]|nr:hypothetical protein [Terracidiphilus sp.]